ALRSDGGAEQCREVLTEARDLDHVIAVFEARQREDLRRLAVKIALSLRVRALRRLDRAPNIRRRFSRHYIRLRGRRCRRLAQRRRKERHCCDEREELKDRTTHGALPTRRLRR